MRIQLGEWPWPMDGPSSSSPSPTYAMPPSTTFSPLRMPCFPSRIPRWRRLSACAHAWVAALSRGRPVPSFSRTSRAPKTIAYSDGQDVRFASAAKLQRTVDRVCRGGWGTSGGGGSSGGEAAVTALAFDVISPEILYVGSETGEVMVSVH